MGSAFQHYVAGQNVSVPIELIDEGGNPIVPTAVSYTVFDEGDSIVVGPTVIAGPWSSPVTVEVLAANNALAGGSVRGLRRVRLTVTTATGQKLCEGVYAIELEDPLVVPFTSFQTYSQALVTGLGLMSLDAWNSASRADRCSALQVARDNLCVLTYRWETFIDPQTHLEPRFLLHNLDLVSADEFTALPFEFQAALKRAQVMQANHLLGPSSEFEQAKKWREAGIMSMKNGETGQFFRSGKPLKYPVCEDSLRILARYIQFHKRTGRS
jgi:hypothetical protein